MLRRAEDSFQLVQHDLEGKPGKAMGQAFSKARPIGPFVHVHMISDHALKNKKKGAG
jgi:hypothetical protein